MPPTSRSPRCEASYTQLLCRSEDGPIFIHELRTIEMAVEAEGRENVPGIGFALGTMTMAVSGLPDGYWRPFIRQRPPEAGRTGWVNLRVQPDFPLEVV
jgi:hypothetical protein